MANVFFAIPFGIVAIVGLFMIIYAENIKNFVNKLDPLRTGYGKQYFILMGIILIIVSILMMITVLLQ